jgi:uncharacterized alkaline shock family protein YloU
LQLAKEKIMTDYTRPPGKTTIAPEVLTTIARMAALSVPGVSEMAPVTGGVNRLFQRGSENGVQIAIHENMVAADIFIIVKEEVNIREVGRNVQRQVTRAIQEMTGMEVAQVDVHIEDIHYEGTQEA